MMFLTCEHGIRTERHYRDRTHRAQHGPNPEHVLVITDEELFKNPDPNYGILRLHSWVSAIHEREGLPPPEWVEEERV